MAIPLGSQSVIARPVTPLLVGLFTPDEAADTVRKSSFRQDKNFVGVIFEFTIDVR